MTKSFGALLRLALASICVTMLCASAYADYVIRQDPGGHPEYEWNRYESVKRTGERVVIDGECKSACTIVLSVIPLERICATSKASMHFHAVRYADTNAMSNKWTAVLFSSYPPNVQSWVREHNALGSLEFKVLRGPELEAIVQRCPEPLYSGQPQTTGKSAGK
jgi:hypothetical protein